MPRKPFYTARAHVTGGREHGRGATNDGLLDVELRPAPELGGDGGGTNPEQLFAVGYAACFEGALMAAGRRERISVDDVAIDSQVSLVATEDRRFELVVELHVTLPSVEDPQQAIALVQAAHRICPYSNATRGNIDVTLTANGQPVSP
jgi:lipoyl-dependent peroxiredoxin